MAAEYAEKFRQGFRAANVPPLRRGKILQVLNNKLGEQGMGAIIMEAEKPPHPLSVQGGTS